MSNVLHEIYTFKAMVEIRMMMLVTMIIGKISWLHGGKTTLEVVVVWAKKGSELEQRH